MYADARYCQPATQCANNAALNLSAAIAAALFLVFESAASAAGLDRLLDEK